MRSLFAVTAALIGLCACSVYQSPGRKFLEKQAYEFAGVSAQAYQTSCQNGPASGHWVRLSRGPQADVYISETNSFELRVVPAADNVSDFSCDYAFPSAQEMFEKMPAAVDLTVSQMSAF